MRCLTFPRLYTEFSVTLSLSFSLFIFHSIFDFFFAADFLSLTDTDTMSKKDKDAVRKEHISAFSSWLVEGSKTPPTQAEETALRQVKRLI